MRKSFLVRPKLQIRHLVWTVGSVSISFIVGYILFESMVSAAIQNGDLGPEEWMAVKSSLRIGFSVVLVFLLAAVGLENFLFFHRIVGPLYALEKGLKRMAEGDFEDAVMVRESDELKDLVASFEEMKAKIFRRITSNEELARKMARELDKIMANISVENIPHLRQKLKEIREQVEKKAA